MRAVFDTNVLIDYLAGVGAARDELRRYESPAVSIVTWMEVLVGARDEAEHASLEQFLKRFEVVPLDEAIARRAVALRQAERLRLPDAIIWATAVERGQLLVTRNTRDFPEEDPGVRVPYRD